MSRDHQTRLELYDYPLPQHLIAQEPATPRDASRLLVLDRREPAPGHRIFADLPALLAAGDLLVLNDTRVFPARLPATKPTGGVVDCLFVRRDSAGRWEVLCNATRELRSGMSLDFRGATARVEGRREEMVVLSFDAGVDVDRLLERSGSVPLPPYIRRPGKAPDPVPDAERYQTVYARHRGAVAAPTAGLHFTRELLGRLEAKGIRHTFVTLHVGPGTFLPVRVEDAREHRVAAERFVLPPEAVGEIEAARRRGGRVVAVGTTVGRVLEHAALRGITGPAEGECDLTVLPGHEFRRVDALLTNFHLPRSTLLLFVAAFAGRQRILSAYREAIARGYRFYSYGDAMLIL